MHSGQIFNLVPAMQSADQHPVQYGGMRLQTVVTTVRDLFVLTVYMCSHWPGHSFIFQGDIWMYKKVTKTIHFY